MRKLIMPAIAALALGAATPAMAYDTGGHISMQRALDVAGDMGMATISHTEYAGDDGRSRVATFPAATWRSMSM